jgi:hypothetical protein
VPDKGTTTRPRALTSLVCRGAPAGTVVAKGTLVVTHPGVASIGGGSGSGSGSRLVLPLLAWWGLLSSGCGQDPAASDPDVTRISHAIAGGALDDGHAAVVAIGPRRSDCSEALRPFCTGTLIAPDVVLTAAHCFAGRASWASYEVMIGTDARRAGTFFHVIDVAIAPDFDDASHHADLALLRLAETSDVAPVLLPARDDPAPRPGAAVTIVGFGAAAASDPSSVGQKRAGAAAVGEVADDNFTIASAPAQSCFGDSGGPVLIASAAGDTLIGVTSYGDAACAVSGSNTRVDRFLASFITPGMAAPKRPRPDSLQADLALLCSQPCNDNVDCPVGFGCADVVPGVGGLCVIDGRTGAFGDPCFDDSACGSGICTRVAEGIAPGACRCFDACAAMVSTDTGEPGRDAADAGEPIERGAMSGAGCAVAVARPSMWAAGLVVLGLLREIRRRPTRRSSREGERR